MVCSISCCCFGAKSARRPREMQPRTSAMDTQSSCPPTRMSPRRVFWAAVLGSVIFLVFLWFSRPTSRC
jgi:hypothetical protein